MTGPFDALDRSLRDGPPDEVGSPYFSTSAFAGWPGLLAEPDAPVTAAEIEIIARRHGLKNFAISAHLVGQGLHDGRRGEACQLSHGSVMLARTQSRPGARSGGERGPLARACPCAEAPRQPRTRGRSDRP